MVDGGRGGEEEERDGEVMKEEETKNGVPKIGKENMKVVREICRGN